MPSVYDENQLAQVQAANTAGTPATNAATGASAQPTASTATQGTQTQAASPYTGLRGLNANTAQKIGQTQQDYQASDAVNQAYQNLQALMNNGPGNWDASGNTWYQQAQNILGQIGNRGQFTYDINNDMLYQQARDQYIRNGQQAMMDTMGQAAGLTGGYGSSYANTAGNQAYQQYLTQLNNNIGDYYDRAYQRWSDEGDRLQQGLGNALQMYGTDFDAYRANLDKYNADRSFASDYYSTMYNQDYGQYRDAQNYWYQVGTGENSDYWTNTNYAYQNAMANIQQGVVPDAATLEAAGIDPTAAANLAAQYANQIALEAQYRQAQIASIYEDIAASQEARARAAAAANKGRGPSSPKPTNDQPQYYDDRMALYDLARNTTAQQYYRLLTTGTTGR